MLGFSDDKDLISTKKPTRGSDQMPRHESVKNYMDS